jgi:hypothetical protein
VFVRDLETGDTTRVSVDSQGTEANNESGFVASAIGGDGRYVAFSSLATNLVPEVTTGMGDVFVHDCVTGRTELASMDSAGHPGDHRSVFSSLSADGRYVAFYSFATNLVPGDNNGAADVFVHDRLTGQTELVSVSSDGVPGNDRSGTSSDGGLYISANGRYVAFMSVATNLVPAADATPTLTPWATSTPNPPDTPVATPTGTTGTPTATSTPTPPDRPPGLSARSPDRADNAGER